MMKNSGLIVIALVAAISTSCGPSQEDLARVRIGKANSCLQNLDTAQALVELDSVFLLHPKAVYSLNAAKGLKNAINLDLLLRDEASLESVNSLIVVLEGNFVKEKTEYDHYLQYIHKRQNFDSRWNKSYLKVNLDERGEISFSSNYYGQQWLNHTGIRVYDGPNQASTGKVELTDPNNHRSDFMETKWEKVTYVNGKGDDVINQIAANQGLKFKAVFLGNSEYYTVLEDYDKAAFRDALALSKALKERVALENEIKRLQKVLNNEV